MLVSLHQTTIKASQEDEAVCELQLKRLVSVVGVSGLSKVDAVTLKKRKLFAAENM